MLKKIRCKFCKKVIVLLENEVINPLPNIKIKTITSKQVKTTCKCGTENIITIK